MQRSKVDLPLPDLPSKATTSPGCTSSDTPSNTGSSPSTVANDFVNESTTTNADGSAERRARRSSPTTPISQPPSAGAPTSGALWRRQGTTDASASTRLSPNSGAAGGRADPRRERAPVTITVPHRSHLLRALEALRRAEESYHQGEGGRRRPPPIHLACRQGAKPRLGECPPELDTDRRAGWPVWSRSVGRSTDGQRSELGDGVAHDLGQGLVLVLAYPALHCHPHHRGPGLGGQARCRFGHPPLAQGSGNRRRILGQLGQLPLAQLRVAGNDG